MYRGDCDVPLGQKTMRNSPTNPVLGELGWLQGSILQIPNAPVSWLRRASTDEWESETAVLGPGDLLVVVSHDCDLARGLAQEPRVECVRAYWTDDKAEIRNAYRNSVRKFLLERRTESGVVRGLIADATVRIQLDKLSLVGILPVQISSLNDEEHLARFRDWLAARYDRAALPDEIVEAVHRPIVDAIRALLDEDEISTLLELIREVRIRWSVEGPPFAVEFLLMRDEARPGIALEDAGTIAAWLDEVLQAAGSAYVLKWDVYDNSSISVRDYSQAYDLALDEFSLPEMSGQKFRAEPRLPASPEVEGMP